MTINNLIEKIEGDILPKLKDIKTQFGNIEIKINTPKENYNIDNIKVVEVTHKENLVVVLTIN